MILIISIIIIIITLFYIEINQMREVEGGPTGRQRQGNFLN